MFHCLLWNLYPENCKRKQYYKVPAYSITNPLPDCIFDLSFPGIKQKRLTPKRQPFKNKNSHQIAGSSGVAGLLSRSIKG